MWISLSSEQNETSRTCSDFREVGSQLCASRQLISISEMWLLWLKDKHTPYCLMSCYRHLFTRNTAGDTTDILFTVNQSWKISNERRMWLPLLSKGHTFQIKHNYLTANKVKKKHIYILSPEINHEILPSSSTSEIKKHSTLQWMRCMKVSVKLYFSCSKFHFIK